MIVERGGECLDAKPASVESKKAVEEHFTSNDKRYVKTQVYLYTTFLIIVQTYDCMIKDSEW